MIRVSNDDRQAFGQTVRNENVNQDRNEGGHENLDRATPIGQPPAPGQILTTQANFVPTGSVNWQTAMKRAVRSSSELARRLNLPADPDIAAEKDFPTFVPLEFLARIRPGDPGDPLLRQVMPIVDEDSADPPGYTSDPVGDLNSLATGGLLHKYQGRALVVTTGACGVHCRYCFRRQFPYSESSLAGQDFSAAIEYLRRHDEIDEVLLSGGDPLTMTDAKLFNLLDEIESVGHVRRVRIHSRMPIVIPQRITVELVERLRASRLTAWVVVHANHPAELDDHVFGHTDRLIDAGIPVMNQAVLLRGVNDDVDTMAKLCTRLVDHRIMPYYLHQLDRISGAAHFEVPVSTGRQIIDELRTRLPGYAVPSFVVEQPGQESKTPL